MSAVTPLPPKSLCTSIQFLPAPWQDSQVIPAMGLASPSTAAEVKWQPRQSLSLLIRRIPIAFAISLALSLRGKLLKVVAWCVSFQTPTEDLWHSPQAAGPFTRAGSRRISCAAAGDGPASRPRTRPSARAVAPSAGYNRCTNAVFSILPSLHI